MNALDVEGWRRAARASTASELKAQRLEREAARQRDQSELACHQAQQAWSEAESTRRAAHERWLEQVAQADRAAQTGVRGGQAIVEAFAFCGRQSDQAEQAASAAAAAADTLAQRQALTAQACQALVAKRARLQATRAWRDQHRSHILRAIDGLRDLDMEEDAAVVYAARHRKL